jgi:hypothetical protein
LWKRGGTEAGTLLVKSMDVVVGSSCTYLSNLANVIGTRFFKGYDHVHGQEL